MIEVHGAARKVRCARGGCTNGPHHGSLAWDESLFAAFRADPRLETVPRCPKCGKLLRPHVLWFDETYLEHADYRFHDAERWMVEADLVVFVGTSFSVMITEHALDGARMLGTPVWSIDPISEPPEDSTAKWLQAPSEVTLPAVVAGWDAA